MPSQIYMRDVIRQMYPGRGWAKRVDKMPDGQVLAMYNKTLQTKPTPKKEEKHEEAPKLDF